MGYLDPHSVTDSGQPLTQSIDLHLKVDFSSKSILGTATLKLKQRANGILDLDYRGLQFERVVAGDGQQVNYELQKETGKQGSRIRLFLEGSEVTLHYTVPTDATALQWLDPPQTAGGKLPFVFTQCQAIHARSIFPCQDTPAARIGYTARIEVPKDMHVVMAANHKGREELENTAVESFFTEEPIPPYLFAFAAGDLTSMDLGPRSRIYAEPSQVEAAAWEFEGVEKLIVQAEALFGPYLWGRFDMLLMPPSFPYGGMENPRMTFLTPTLIAGDRSLVNVVAHELAHSWTGNLVTNATANDFWLNEGFTVYAERRILEIVEGADRVALHAAIGHKNLLEAIHGFGQESPYTKLRMDLEGVDPDEVFSVVPYEKGYLFLRKLEDTVGRAAFDRFLKAYIAKYQFQSLNTQTFLDFLTAQLPGIDSQVNLPAWVDAPGLPADAPLAKSAVLDQIELLAGSFANGVQLSSEDTASWKALEWQLYLESLPKELPVVACEELDRRFQFSKSNNAEIRINFLTIAAHSGYIAAYPAIKQSLMTIGRMKYLKPLYKGLLTGGPEGKPLAEEVFRVAAPKYHPVARAVIAGLLHQRTV